MVLGSFTVTLKGYSNKRAKIFVSEEKDQFYPGNTNLNFLGKRDRDRERKKKKKERVRVVSTGEKVIKAIKEKGASPRKSEMRFQSIWEKKKKEGGIPLSSRKMGYLVSLVLFIDSILFFFLIFKMYILSISKNGILDYI